MNPLFADSVSLPSIEFFTLVSMTGAVRTYHTLGQARGARTQMAYKWKRRQTEGHSFRILRTRINVASQIETTWVDE